ncbi:MAG: flagellin FliC [Syntrophus sp. (in: bacteria)]|nr:flagellin FliC [Syntrophus sp. (in: bacteria)]
MAFRIATNTASINTQKYLSANQATQDKALQRLSSGTKVASAKDDAAGAAISLKLNVKAASLAKGIDNGNQAIGMLQTAESAMNTASNILLRLKELATQAASSNTVDRDKLETESNKLETALDNISTSTKYGDTAVFGTGTFTFQLGDTNSTSEQVSFSQVSVSAASIGATSLATGGLDSVASAQAYITAVDTAIASINTNKATIGATMNQIQFQVDNMTSMYENTKAANSTITDADFAGEMADFTKAQILQQSGVSMLSQANQAPQMALSLLKG